MFIDEIQSNVEYLTLAPNEDGSNGAHPHQEINWTRIGGLGCPGLLASAKHKLLDLKHA